MKASVVILAAGEGTRMSSGLPKAMQFLAGQTMLEHVKHTADSLSSEQTIIVCSPGAEKQMVKTLGKPDQGLAYVQQTEHLGTGHALMCSLSKIFAPGVRLGYLTASSNELFDQILARRHDAGPNTLAAAITARYLEDNLWEHCERANVGLKERRDAMLDALELELGNLCSWSHPPGGLFIWVQVPDEVDLERLEALASECEVSFAFGWEFHIDATGGPFIRLAFGWSTVTDIYEGIARLARCIEQVVLARSCDVG